MSDLQESVILHEAIRAKPYKCPAGFWTFGVGRNLEANPLTGAEWKHLLDAGLITVSIANQGSLDLLDNDISACRAQCEKAFSFWPKLDEIRRDVLIEMAFQMGIAGVMQFHGMLHFIEQGFYASAAKEGLDSKWAKQTPARAKELMGRLEKGA